ncbi:MAG: hypothetical protein NZ824_01285 [Candidatus Thioglobus sp.]|nr:hypothetical protein [Candidatus Thioglobus sp.]
MSKKLILGLMVVIGLSGCMGSEISQKNETEKVVLKKEAKLSSKYLKQISIISGRLDGMNKAIIQGLGETLDTARLAREMAENALALAEKNKALLEELKNSKTSSAGDNAGEGNEEEAQEDDF